MWSEMGLLQFPVFPSPLSSFSSPHGMSVGGQTLANRSLVSAASFSWFRNGCVTIGTKGKFPGVDGREGCLGVQRSDRLLGKATLAERAR